MMKNKNYHSQMTKFYAIQVPWGYMGTGFISDNLAELLMPKPELSDVLSHWKLPGDTVQPASLPYRGALDCKQVGSYSTKAPPSSLSHFLEDLEAYFQGRRVNFCISCTFEFGTPFSQRVWSATQMIPHGKVETYGWLAERLGSPKAARAVGNALAHNPLPLVVPCHRVISAGGKLGGYSGGGPTVKEKLLTLEKSWPISSPIC